MRVSKWFRYFSINNQRISKKLIIPVLFFTIELVLIIILNWQLFGERSELIPFGGSENQVALHNPLIIVKYLHSDRLTQPFGPDSELSSFFTIPHYTSVVTAFCYLLSLLCACWGLFISTLWVNRFLHKNKLDIVWWIWPAGCFGCHFLLYILANSQNITIL